MDRQTRGQMAAAVYGVVAAFVVVLGLALACLSGAVL
jgi:hypothetical protein